MSDSAGDQPRRPRNITELARLAGVSPGTVSRALAGSDLVKAGTRDRIQALAREHGFRLNQMASRLRTGQTGVIGVVIPLGHERKQHISDPFFMTLLGHLADELVDRGYDIMLSRALPEDERHWLDRIISSGMIDGILMIGQSDQFATIEAVAQHYLPLVVWGAWQQGQHHCVVGTDSFAGGRLAARHLIGRGCRKLAFFGDTNGFEIGQRLAGFRAGAAESGTGASVAEFPARLSAAEMASQIPAYLDTMDPGTDGIFAASDMIAITTLRQLHERGRKVPEDVALIGFDDLPMATQTVPQLTTIRQDIAGGARAMVNALLQRIAGEPVPSTVIEPQLVIRESA